MALSIPDDGKIYCCDIDEVFTSVAKKFWDEAGVSKKIELLRRSKSNYQFSWHIEGPFDSSYSLSILNRYFAEGLNQAIDNVSINITEGPGDYEPDINYLKRYKNIFNIFSKSSKKVKTYDVVSRNMYPPRVSD